MNRLTLLVLTIFLFISLLSPEVEGRRRGGGVRYSSGSSSYSTGSSSYSGSGVLQEIAYIIIPFASIGGTVFILYVIGRVYLRCCTDITTENVHNNNELTSGKDGFIIYT